MAFDVSDGGRFNGDILCFLIEISLALKMAFLSLQETFSVVQRLSRPPIYSVRKISLVSFIPQQNNMSLKSQWM